MPRSERQRLIKELSTALGFPVITYITSTRRGAEAQMSIDAVRYVYEHLHVLVGKQKVLGLLIHSYGGDPGTSWRLMSLLREYGDNIVIIAPYQAFSAATLLALGADKILMHPMAALGPIDPSIINPLNPKGGPNNEPLPVSVEDVLSYIALVKEDVRINHEDQLVQTFIKLADTVHPLALGNVKRSHSQGRLLAKKLMELRETKVEEHKIAEIAENLTSKLYYHGHPINRQEAITLDLPVEIPKAKVEQAMWDLYCEYEKDMKLAIDFNPVAELAQLPIPIAAPTPPAQAPAMPPGVPLPPGVQAPSGAVSQPVILQPSVVSADVELPFVFVESENRSDCLVNTIRLSGIRDPVGGIVNARASLQRSGWRENFL